MCVCATERRYRTTEGGGGGLTPQYPERCSFLHPPSPPQPGTHAPPTNTAFRSPRGFSLRQLGSGTAADCISVFAPSLFFLLSFSEYRHHLWFLCLDLILFSLRVRLCFLFLQYYYEVLPQLSFLFLWGLSLFFSYFYAGFLCFLFLFLWGFFSFLFLFYEGFICFFPLFLWGVYLLSFPISMRGLSDFFSYFYEGLSTFFSCF